MKKQLLLILLFTPFYQFAANYYVSPSGSDSNSGAAAQPWKTIQHSIDQMAAGDYLFVNDGVYNEKLVFHNSGTVSDYISVWANGDNAVLDGTGLTSANAMIDITDHSYIWVRGLEIRNNIMNDAQGILVNGNCQGIRITDNKIHDIHFSANPNDVADETKNAQALIVFGSSLSAIMHLEISGNEIYNCRLGYSEGIAVNGNVEDFTVSGNYVHDLTNIGIVAIGHEGTCADPDLDQARNGVISSNRTEKCNSPYAYCGGIYIDGAMRIAIFQNSSSFNDYGIEIGCEHPGKTASQITARNNMVFSNKYAGIAIGGYDYPANSGSVMMTEVFNNTLYQNDTENDGNGEIVVTYVENTLIENNIFYPSAAGRAITFASEPVNLGFDYNLYYVLSGVTDNLVQAPADDLTFAQFQQSGQETHGMYANALIASGTFQEESASALVMGASSPIVNAGNPNYEVFNNETDYFGNTRIVNNRIDIGASEFASNLGLPENQLSFTIYPNPAASTIFIASEMQLQDFVVTDLAGKTVLSGNTAGEINVRALLTGTYLLTLPGKGTTRFTRQ